MPKHQDRRHPLSAHLCPPRTRRGNRGGSHRNPHSRAVFLPLYRAYREPDEETREHWEPSSPIGTPTPAAVDRQATPPTKWLRSLDLIQVVSSTHSQLTA